MPQHAIELLPHLSEAELFERYHREGDPKVARRWQALWLRVQGRTPTEVAALVGVKVQTVRSWVKRYNTEGEAGVQAHPPPGRRCYLSPAQIEELRGLLRTPPPGAPAWTGPKLIAEVEHRYGVRYSNSGMLDLVHQLGFRRVLPRPRHPKADTAVQETFKKKRWPRRCGGFSAAPRADA